MKNPFISNDTRTASSVLFDEPGPIAQRRIRIFNIAAVVAFRAICGVRADRDG